MSSRDTWETRYAESAPVAPPSAFVDREARAVLETFGPTGRTPLALDLACGNGRHSIHLRKIGFRVVALDFSRNALTSLIQKEASLWCVAADALALPLRESVFDLIVQTRFLERRIFRSLGRLLRPRGRLVVETFALGQHELTGHPRREFCLEPEELDRLCRDAGLRVIEPSEAGGEEEIGGALLESAVAERP